MLCLSRKEDIECKNALCPFPVGRYYILLNLKLSPRIQPYPSVLFQGSLLVSVLALLICNSAAGLASGLAGSLALAATAVLCAVAKILCIQGLNTLHINILRFIRIL